jgi:hypothetical protein
MAHEVLVQKKQKMSEGDLTVSVFTKSEARSRVARMWAVAGFALVSLSSTGFAQTTTACGPDVKEAVLKAIAAVANSPDSVQQAAYDDIYKRYQFCAQDAKLAPGGFFAAAAQCGAAVSNLGSLFYEEMSCSGYDPQRRQFASPIKIKQVFGFGGAPLPGSREYVLHCVQDPNGVFQPVGRDSVHLSNALPGQAPTWQFAVITSANENLELLQPMNNTTRVARSILSWGLPPNGCAFNPIWGNALNYRIRLDQ